MSYTLLMQRAKLFIIPSACGDWPKFLSNTIIMASSKKEKDRELLQEYIDRFEKLEQQRLFTG
jgi:hypothetical protein